MTFSVRHALGRLHHLGSTMQAKLMSDHQQVLLRLCRSCRHSRPASRPAYSTTCTPGHRRSPCRRSAGAHRTVQAVVAPKSLRAPCVRPKVCTRRFKEELQKPSWTTVHARLAASLWRALDQPGAHLLHQQVPERLRHTCSPPCVPHSPCAPPIDTRKKQQGRTPTSY